MINMKMSAKGLDLLSHREGVRLKAYKDSVGIWTIGVGHTGRIAPPQVTQNQTITKQQAMDILAADLGPTEASVNAALHRPITQNQFDACVSLAFNIGGHAFANSTVARDINEGNLHHAADAFLLWVKPPELRGRRLQERAQFLTT